MKKTESEIREEIQNLEQMRFQAQILRKSGGLSKETADRRIKMLENMLIALRWVLGEKG